MKYRFHFSRFIFIAFIGNCGKYNYWKRRARNILICLWSIIHFSWSIIRIIWRCVNYCREFARWSNLGFYTVIIEIISNASICRTIANIISHIYSHMRKRHPFVKLCLYCALTRSRMLCVYVLYMFCICSIYTLCIVHSGVCACL